MIRLIQRRLIIPRGDTGSFTIPVIKPSNENIAVFTIFDETTHTKLFQKRIVCEGDVMNIAFSHNDTVNLKPGKYLWDIKYYSNPLFVEDELVDGEEIDSYYAGYSLPACEIRPTGDDYLVSDDAPSATLAPDQLDIIRNAIIALNNAVEQTQTNVEHYPVIRDEIWYVWDAESNEYISTGVDANGIAGNGIASAVLNNDYSLTLNFTDGTSFTSPSIRGETGNGIDDIVLNNDFTLTIIYTDGERYTTPSIRGPVGATPHFSIGTVQEGPSAAASITGTAENPVLNLTLSNAYVPTRVSELENDSNYAVDANYVHTDNNYTTVEKEKLSGIAAGAEVNVNADWNANSGDAQILNKPTNVSDFTNDAGYLTEHQNLSDYVQKTDYATTEVGGIVKVGEGTYISSGGKLRINKATDNLIKEGTNIYCPIVPSSEHNATFYGLAKSAGDTTQSQSDNPIGQYTAEAKAAIQTMLDVPSNADIPTQVSELTNDAGYLTTETDPTVPAWAKAAQKPTYTASEVGAPTVAEMNTAIGTAIGQINSFDMAVVQALPTQDISTHTIYLVPKTGETNDVYDEYVYINNDWEMVGNTQIDLSDYALKSELPDVPVQDVQIDGTSIVENGVANVPVASDMSNPGLVKINSTYGIAISNRATGNVLIMNAATANEIKSGQGGFKTITPTSQHHSVFYGLAKVAGDTTQSQSSNAPGQYTDEAKTAIQTMLDVPAKGDIPEVPVQDVQINGTSVLNAQGIANIPAAPITDILAPNGTSWIDNGIIQFGYGLGKNTENKIAIVAASTGMSKTGTTNVYPLTPSTQHAASFYGLAKAAGDSTQSASNNAIGTYTDEAKTAIQQMLGVPSISEIPDVPVQDVQINGVSALSNGVANMPVASGNDYGVVKISQNLGVNISNGYLCTSIPDTNMLKGGTNTYKPIVPSIQHTSIFYGLSKVAGVDLANENVTLGTYPESAKTAIRSMLGATSNNVIAVQDATPTDPDTKIWLPETPTAGIQVPTVQEMEAAINSAAIDVQVAGTSIVGSDGIANIPVASPNDLGVIKVVRDTWGLFVHSTQNYIGISKATDAEVKAGVHSYKPIVPNNQHLSTFYGLSKVAGVDLANETVTLGTYPEASKTAIRTMLGATSSNIIAVQDTQPTDPDTKIWLPVTAETSVQVPTVAEMNTALSGKVGDVQVNGTSVVSGGVANVPVADANLKLGLVQWSNTGFYGVVANSIGRLYIFNALEADIKAGTSTFRPITPSNQDASSFYGLAKAAGADMAQSSNAVGQYTDAAKTAIKAMIGVEEGLRVVRLI